MLVYSPLLRVVLQFLAVLVVSIIYLDPLAVIVIASFANQWNGILPTAFTLGHFYDLASSTLSDAIRVSLLTGLLASLIALVTGTWAALALRKATHAVQSWLGMIFFIPSAVPSVSVGLGLLVAFSQRPLLLNGTTVIVIIAHFILVSAFTFGNVSAGLMRLSPDYEWVAASLGARPGYQLRHVVLPLVRHYLLAAFVLSFALSMGELGATIMVYPPGWVTMPVAIFGLTDRGDIFSGAALTVVLIVTTLALMLLVEKLTPK